MAAERTILLAAGGTAGHLFPALALAEELLASGHRVLIATDHRTAHYNFPKDVEVKVLSTRSLGGGLSKKLQGGAGLLKSLVESFLLLKRKKPDIVVGFGGYPSFPPLMIARLMRIPFVLHEQNRYLGKVNRIFAQAAKRVALSFDDTKGIVNEAVRAKCVTTGNPVRAEVEAITAYQPPNEDGKLNILIFAGSLGASQFSEVVPAAIALLPEGLQKRLYLVQQCREGEIEALKVRYEQLKIEAEIRAFFDDMPQRMQHAHLTISRAGASTIFELIAAGRPALLVPLAIAADDHQTFNAQFLEKHHAAWMLPSSQFTPKAVAARLRYLFETPTVLQQAATQARALHKPAAQKELARSVLEVSD